MPKHTLMSNITYRINGKLTDLVVHASYTTEEDIEIRSVIELSSGSEIELTEEQHAAITFICMEEIPERLASETDYLCDLVIPR